MRDDIENLARVYLEIRQQGCVQFNDVLMRVYCSPKDVTVELTLQSINETIKAKPSAELSQIHCRELYEFLKKCVKEWKDKMAQERR